MASHLRLGRGLATLLITLALSLLASPALAAPPAAPVISVAAARTLPLGSTVTVQGAVTVASGAFRSSTFDLGFAVQDDTGGIYVSIATNLGLTPRQQVRVQGQLADNGFGLLILLIQSPANVKTLGTGPKVAPAPLSTGAVGEASEGRLVRLVATITQPVVDNLPFGYQVSVDDGSGVVQVFVCASTGIDARGLQPGQTIRVVGFSGQFADHYEVSPRVPGDIQVQ